MNEHISRMEDSSSKTARQAVHWELIGYSRKSGRPRKNCIDVDKRDLKDMDITWKEAEELAEDTSRMASKCGSMYPWSNAVCEMNYAQR